MVAVASQGFDEVQVAPCVHEVQTPVDEQTRFVPQLVPAAASAVPVVQVGLFPTQATVSWWQSPPIEHVVPMLATFVAVSTQAWAPVAQEVTPWTHWLGFVEQARPAVQAAHVPDPLQTRFVPQLVPAAMGVVESAQVCAPVAHEVVPCTHWFGLVEQARPAVQPVHTPADVQTRFVPQLVPAAL